MTDVTPDWEERVAKVFTAIDSYDEGELVARIDRTGLRATTGQRDRAVRAGRSL